MHQAIDSLRVFVRHEIHHRYRGSVLGSVWALAQPLALVVIFTVVFASLMAPRLPSGGTSLDYGFYLVGGLLLWNAQTNTLTRLCDVYTQHAGLFRKTPISLLLMPLFLPVVEFLLWLVGIGMLAFVLLAMGDGRVSSLPWVVVVGIFTMLNAFLAGLVFAMLSVFIPDLRSALPVLLQLWFWATPIAYTIDLQPPLLQSLQPWNPLYWGPSKVQALLLNQVIPEFGSMIAWLLVTLGLLLIVKFLHRQLERDIRDLL